MQSYSGGPWPLGQPSDQIGVKIASCRNWIPVRKMGNSPDFLSTLYHALRTPRRRQAIWHIATNDEPVIPVRQLARKIAADELRVRLELATGEPYRNVYNALSQTHLPTLAKADILIYDPKRQTVSRGRYLTIAALLIATNDAAVKSLERSGAIAGEIPP